MKKTTFVALLLLTTQCFAETLKTSLADIESEWAAIYYTMPKSKQTTSYPQLLSKTINLATQFPNNSEPLFWEAVIKASYADHQDAISALTSIHEARDLLIKALSINPETMNGAAYVTLGTLYYMVPKWPIAFGDNAKAREMLETALKINPEGIDSNYYYADFLLSNNEINEAEKYFKKAATVPLNTKTSVADLRLQEEAKIALAKTKKRKLANSGEFLSFFRSTTIR
ncbi:MAG: tetratricopeptide repeat protein [Methylococcaceae bacterium]|nr:tetratricopeptide repeat protein [Methylococcaceae bacterium]